MLVVENAGENIFNSNEDLRVKAPASMLYINEQNEVTSGSNID